ncbi:putative nucleoside-diphosphate kinase [Lupinus albus]|uniref:Nucleoside diphosphate kinase n=1 Tax=Lupinus albus TaxID=3870 RepID=A0A6A4QI23_LUPAL|nr:putative nucleoside-diphosphate kinase [Lupinus albus]
MMISSKVSKLARSLLSASKASPSRFYYEGGRAIAAAASVSLTSKAPLFASNYGRAGSESGSRTWIAGALALPAAAYMLQDQEVHAAEFERTFIAVKPDGVQRGLSHRNCGVMRCGNHSTTILQPPMRDAISEIISRFERKGYKLVGIKVVVPTKEFAGKHYHALKDKPFFNGLSEFLSSGPVVAMVWEGEGVITYGRKLIGATDPQKSEPGTIRGDLAVVVGRNIIHGSDGPETAKDEINLWFKPEELVSFTSNAEKWIYGVN